MWEAERPFTLGVEYMHVIVWSLSSSATFTESLPSVWYCARHRDPSLPTALKEQGPPIAKSHRPCSKEGALPSQMLSAASNTLDPRVRETLSHLGSGHHRCLVFPSPRWPFLLNLRCELRFGPVFLKHGCSSRSAKASSLLTLQTLRGLGFCLPPQY